MKKDQEQGKINFREKIVQSITAARAAAENAEKVAEAARAMSEAARELAEDARRRSEFVPSPAYDESLRFRIKRARRWKAQMKRVKDISEEMKQIVKKTYDDEIKSIRYHLSPLGEPPTVRYIFPKDDAESLIRIYVDPIEFDGTKEELIEYLWENYARRITKPWDCTGEEYTTKFVVGHLGGNRWKVAEYSSIDV